MMSYNINDYFCSGDAITEMTGDVLGLGYSALVDLCVTVPGAE